MFYSIRRSNVHLVSLSCFHWLGGIFPRPPPLKCRHCIEREMGKAEHCNEKDNNDYYSIIQCNGNNDNNNNNDNNDNLTRTPCLIFLPPLELLSCFACVSSSYSSQNTIIIIHDDSSSLFYATWLATCNSGKTCNFLKSTLTSQNPQPHSTRLKVGNKILKSP